MHGPSSVDLDLIASTYSPEQFLTALYLENQLLKARHIAAFATQAVPHPEPDQLVRDPDYALAREYVADGRVPSVPRFLVLANEYPRKGAEYGNGFVHRRVKGYLKSGAAVDVVSFGPNRSREIYEYDGVRVLSGHNFELAGLLSSQPYESVSVHFLNAGMWNALYDFRQKSRFVFFLHGYEVDRWIRRDFQLDTPEKLSAAIGRTWQLQRFWAQVVSDQELQGHFVFVSEWWRRLVQEDMEIVVPRERSSIIHNVIDTDLFAYRPKDPEQRFKILWVRSAHTRKYGADLAIECLRRLRESDQWDKFRVHIIGDGEFFHGFEDEFANDPQVLVERRFASQDEIASLHRENGIFLVPTRYDSQGVARDEAMASGLVPVTNQVAAIPEFVDENCAVVAPPEDAAAMAGGILRLAGSPELFSSMSQAAAARAARQCGPAATVARETALLRMTSEVEAPW